MQITYALVAFQLLAITIAAPLPVPEARIPSAIKGDKPRAVPAYSSPYNRKDHPRSAEPEPEAGAHIPGALRHTIRGSPSVTNRKLGGGHKRDAEPEAANTKPRVTTDANKKGNRARPAYYFTSPFGHNTGSLAGRSAEPQPAVAEGTKKRIQPIRPPYYYTSPFNNNVARRDASPEAEPEARNVKVLNNQGTTLLKAREPEARNVRLLTPVAALKVREAEPEARNVKVLNNQGTTLVKARDAEPEARNVKLLNNQGATLLKAREAEAEAKAEPEARNVKVLNNPALLNA